MTKVLWEIFSMPETKKKNWFSKHPVLSVIIGIVVLVSILSLFSSNNSKEDSLPTNKPVSNCVPNWQCSEWSECSSLETQTRGCEDENSCRVGTGKPIESQSCTIQIVEPEQILLSGSGKKATELFKLENGLSIFEMENSGSSNFIVWLLDNKGNQIELLANEIGSYKISTALGVEAGDYLLDVTGGSWKITIKQPRPTSAQTAPKTFTGKSHIATEFFKLNDGLVRFEMKYSGERNFIVWLLDNKGNQIELLANEIGSFTGSKAIGVDEGIYLLDVTGTGSWQVDVS